MRVRTQTGATHRLVKPRLPEKTPPCLFFVVKCLFSPIFQPQCGDSYQPSGNDLGSGFLHTTRPESPIYGAAGGWKFHGLRVGWDGLSALYLGLNGKPRALPLGWYKTLLWSWGTIKEILISCQKTSPYLFLCFWVLFVDKNSSCCYLFWRESLFPEEIKKDEKRLLFSSLMIFKRCENPKWYFI